MEIIWMGDHNSCKDPAKGLDKVQASFQTPNGATVKRPSISNRLKMKL